MAYRRTENIIQWQLSDQYNFGGTAGRWNFWAGVTFSCCKQSSEDNEINMR
jgi:hypothetical protein